MIQVQVDTINKNIIVTKRVILLELEMIVG